MLQLFVISVAVCAVLGPFGAEAQEARRRWEMQRQIRLDKFDHVLPVAMRTHGIDMWIVAVKENHDDPLWEDLGRGYVSGVGYYVFTDRGEIASSAQRSGHPDTSSSSRAPTTFLRRPLRCPRSSRSAIRNASG